MNFWKLLINVAIGCVLLGVSTAQAQTVLFEDPEAPTKATGILALNVSGTLYDVAFNSQKFAFENYGPYPGTFTFPNTADGALAAVDAVNAALNNRDALSVGQVGGPEVDGFATGYDSFLGPLDVEAVNTARALLEGADWLSGGVNQLTYNADERTWAIFTVAGGSPPPPPPPPPPSEPVTIGGTITGLVGSGLVLQNNGSDDLPIEDGDGPFTFVTPLTPDTSYNVTVATNPTNPAQTCSVENGSGQVPTEAVTNVAVSCVEAVVRDISKVAAEGDTLLDGTVLRQILLDGGVAINTSSKLAFGGRPDTDSSSAVFTQDGLIVKEGAALPDGNIVSDLSPFGEVAISGGQSGDQVAFHGQVETGLIDTNAVFTQAGLVVKEGDTLGDTIVNKINPEGKVAMNDFGAIAFHGKTEVEGDGLGREEFRAVFTEAGLVVKEGDTVGDTTVGSIDETGGVAINEVGEIAFHGEVVTPDAGTDTVPAVFTQAGLVAKIGDTLGDDILGDIDETGGVSINFFGHVAFHGDVVDPDAGGDTVSAVFTQDGVVVKEGDTLTDGTIVDHIDETGGVEINIFGDVVFHGRTDGVEAVFTQKGLVAKEGDTLPDGTTTLDQISPTGGVALNLLGEVAFHGKFGTTDAVFLGKTP